MPKQNINHQNTIIYKIVSKDLNNKDCYVGSTTSFSKRKNQHKTLSKTSDLLLYSTIRKNGEWNNWEMIEIEKFPCNDKNEATARERHYVELYKANLNNYTPNRTYKEWKIDNPNYMKNYFQSTLKTKTKHCDCCKKDMKYMSWTNHTRSNEHKQNNEKNNKYTQQTNSKYYIHDAINVPYPIFLLKDIEIHYVHENNNEIALNKFNKRIERLKKMINNNHKIFITMSFSQFINKHDNYELLIDKFLEKSNNKNIIKIFIGPKEFYKEKYGVNYMILFEWNNFNFERNKSNIFMSNDENLCVEKIKQLIEKFI